MKNVFLTVMLMMVACAFSQQFTEIKTGMEADAFENIIWGDLDNDGDLDFVTAGSYKKIYLNDGTGVFTDTGFENWGHFRNADLGDYDNDGDLDILYSGDWTSVYRNDSGTFTEVFPDLPGSMDSNALWGDYDNDGDLDVLLTDHSTAKIYRNEGNEVFSDINAVFMSLEFSKAWWVDYDCDGLLDVMLIGDDMAGMTGSKTILYKNEGNEVFTEIISTLPDAHISLADWGDYDNDGDPDLLFTGYTSAPVTMLYRNDGNGVFTAISAGLIGVYMGGGQWGDFDNDGDLDIILSGVYTNYPWTSTTRVYRNEGGDVFTDISASLYGMRGKPIWGDFDNDSDLDIFLSGYYYTTNWNPVTKLYMNNCVTPNTVPVYPAGLSSESVNGSVILSWEKASDSETPQNGLSYNIYIGTSPYSEIIKSSMSDIGTGYRKIVNEGNSGQNNFWTIKGLEPGIYYWSVQSIDHTFEGSDFATESYFWLPNNAIEATEIGSNSFTANWEASQGAEGYIIDVDDDSDFSSPLSGYDALNAGNVLSKKITGLDPETLYYYRVRAYGNLKTSLNSNTISVETGDYFTEVTTGISVEPYDDIIWGDLDNDGDLDLITAGFNRIYRNDGAGGFVNTWSIGGDNKKVDLGDYDNDGDLDILFSGMGVANIFRNGGNCAFTQITTTFPWGNQESNAVWGDYDNDGDLDIALTGSVSEIGYVTSIYRNDGNGVFTDINADLMGFGYSFVNWVDYNCDGFLDVILMSGSSTILYKNEGNGVFSDIYATLPVVSDGSADWGDYDNDGDPDLILTGISLTKPHSRIYRNDGNGIFTDINAGLLEVWRSCAEWGDFDNDGDLDILLIGTYTNNTPWQCATRVYRNDSGGVFTDISAGLQDILYGGRWGDYDNDGDLDVFLSGFTANTIPVAKLYRNNCETPNTLPSKTTGLVTEIVGDSLYLSFSPSTDSETPQAALTYNIDITLNGKKYLSGMSDLTNGYRKIVKEGNLNYRTNYFLNPTPPPLPHEVNIINWKIQTIDNCFAGSEFTADSIVMPSPRNLILQNNFLMTEFDLLKWEYAFPDTVDHYVMQIDEDSLFNSPMEHSYSISKTAKIVTFLSLPVQDFTGYENMRSHTTYFWRVKPVYINGSLPTVFSKIPASFIYIPYDITPGVPQNITISKYETDVVLNWDAVEVKQKGVTYTVYSSTDPYAEFPAGYILEQSGITTTSWSEPVSENKKFYVVTAYYSLQ